MLDIQEQKCIVHDRVLEYLCECNILLCTKCNNKHLQEYRDHQCEHIDDIRQSLSDVNLGNLDSSSNLENHKFKSYIDDIWKSIKNTSQQIISLHTKEDDNFNYFKELHEYLIVEENKLRKPITENIDLLKESINGEVNKLKSIVNIINLNNNSNNNNYNDSNSSKLNNKIDIHTNNSKNNKSYCVSDIDIDYENELSTNHLVGDDSNSNLEDNSIDNIISTILQSESLQQFYNKNKSNLHKSTECSTHSYDINSTILDLLFQHNINFNKLNINNKSKLLDLSTIVLNKELIQECKDLISKSLHSQPQFENSTSNNNNNRNSTFINNAKSTDNNQTKSTYILSSDDQSNTCTLFNITDTNSIKSEEIIFPFYKKWTYNSFVTIGDLVYVFGCYDKDCLSGERYYRIFSMSSKSVIHEGYMDGIDGATRISVCYDGKSHIYLINGYNIHRGKFLNRIDRFNIHTKQFERYHQSGYAGETILSFFYEGSLYSLPYGESSINIFNPSSHSSEVYANSFNFYNQSVACTDGNGNIYIHTDDRKFVSFNIDTHVTKRLQSLDKDLRYFSLLYSEPSSQIYFMGGKSYGNYYYSIESNKWVQFAIGDTHERHACGGVIINK